MDIKDVVFCVFYGAICIAGLVVALTYWYNELFKKK